MASVVPMAFKALSQAPSIKDALSGIFGSISLTAWICLLLPQLIANYKLQSADGLSMGFLFIWSVIPPLVDREHTYEVTFCALFTSLAPTAIALACYFCFADLVLITQCLYYNTKNARRAARHRQSHHHHHTEPHWRETQPLLAEQRRRPSSSSLSGSQRRREIHAETEPLRKIVTGGDETSGGKAWLYNTLSLVAVYSVGILGWFISYKAGAWDADPDLPVPDSPAEKDAVTMIGLVLGYISAALYLCARIPQIIKNWREKSCEGLALLFFLLSLTGNAAYGASLIAYSQEKDYLVRALPWLLGSLGTIVEDSVIFVQFHLYKPGRNRRSSSAA
ncbi:vacuolar membrane PQ loop repeat protein [Sodiomyces alkalinus F11]|uniref:Vacuolar membrane PQ loop repeat protein n=1 Tax=Sodiomyces alkalinus (strain CBS 110278 / VKM F-3762 / F11) TaxID=1314773 RepID=A0A3N2Q4U3_SODAK|nr:vacuolar membrane PQ loop repeat protein [Sodiomyces alkalinus F11]ROT41717.1 vacuolar membrane PQ loop repeat protein [Sodiomyces alkalinus F11]